jgi:FkbM family methyltransferase
MVDRLSKPQYLFRPSQIIRRFSTSDVVRTPWCEMRVGDDSLGRGIARMGVHELAVSEVIWRLSEGDDLALDVGANIGYFTGLLAQRVREVIALEPNPLLWPLLTQNVGRWNRNIRLEPWAASDSKGRATLYLPPGEYHENQGTATLAAHPQAVSYEVQTVRIADLLAGRRVGVMKMDIEGHEYPALAGAPLQATRDIVFEDQARPPSAVFTQLESAGFTIRGIAQRLTRAQLVEPNEMQPSWDAPTYLATRDISRAERLMSKRGWRCLRPAGPAERARP